MSAQRINELPIVARFLRAYLRTGLRGGFRLTMFLSRWSRQLQRVPIRVGDGEPFHVDLRTGYHELFRGSPWSQPPFEGAEQAVMRAVVQPGDTVYDIGANIGAHTVLLSRLVGPEGLVYAFEPNPGLLGPLRLTVAGLPNTVLHELALSDQDGSATLFVPEDASMASLADWTVDRGAEAGSSHTLHCALRRLDSLLPDGSAPCPDFIKCDVEGAELRVFTGAARTLNRPEAPIILFEANQHTAAGFGLDVDAARAFLDGLPEPRFRFFAVQDDGQLAPIARCAGPHANILAMPQSRVSRMNDLAIGHPRETP